jgi:hypothetical protein
MLTTTPYCRPAEQQPARRVNPNIVRPRAAGVFRLPVAPQNLARERRQINFLVNRAAEVQMPGNLMRLYLASHGSPLAKRGSSITKHMTQYRLTPAAYEGPSEAPDLPDMQAWLGEYTIAQATAEGRRALESAFRDDPSANVDVFINLHPTMGLTRRQIGYWYSAQITARAAQTMSSAAASASVSASTSPSPSPSPPTFAPPPCEAASSPLPVMSMPSEPSLPQRYNASWPSRGRAYSDDDFSESESSIEDRPDEPYPSVRFIECPALLTDTSSAGSTSLHATHYF